MVSLSLNRAGDAAILAFGDGNTDRATLEKEEAGQKESCVRDINSGAGIGSGVGLLIDGAAYSARDALKPRGF